MIFKFNSKNTNLTGFENQLLPSEANGFSSSDKSWSQLEAGRHAAVGVLFIPGSQGIAEVIVTKRSLNVRTHKGQVSFAGGHAEASDLTVFATAKREIQEEIGIEEGIVKAHGIMSPLPSLRVNTTIYPVILTANVSLPDLVLCDDEVAEIYSIPWVALKSENSQPFSFNMFGNWRESQFFRYEDVEIWGLTAGILHKANFS